MCLSRLHRTFEGKGKTIYYGWKIFNCSLDRRALVFKYFDLNDSPHVQTGIWLKADTKGWIRSMFYSNVSSYTRRRYRPGFHMYRERPKQPMREDEILVRVKYRRLLARGSQGFNYSPVLTDVAAEMWVPKRRR